MNPKVSKHISAQKLEPIGVTRLLKRLAWDLNVQPSETEFSSLDKRDWLTYLEGTDARTSQLYESPGEHRREHQFACLLKKYPFPGDEMKRKEVAMKRFHAAEHRCRRVNQRFVARRRVARGAPYEEFFHRARRWIERLIGMEPDFAAIWDKCDFGPGSSVGIHGQNTHKARKLDSDAWSVTPTCLPYARAAMIHDPHIWELLNAGVPVPENLIQRSLMLGESSLDRFKQRFDAKVVLVDANKIVTVPKNAKTERTIAIEPLLNGYVQKGIDEYLRAKLRRVGIDLSDQTRNQRLARIGSFVEALNPYTTIDLSAASDSISIEMVRELLPPAWFAFLNATRSPSYKMEKDEEWEESLRYHKFVSMGNGFCFPLETLIFAALVHSVYAVTQEKFWDFAVYGDDIIVRQSSALLLKEILSYAGFTINVEKSFWFGPFKESCGADFYNGEDVRPYYLDDKLDTVERRIGCLNALARKGLAQGSCWDLVYKSIPPHLRFVRPYPGPDTAIEVPMDVFMGSPFASWNRYLQGWRWKELHITSVSDKRRYSDASLMYGLLRGTKAGQKNGQSTYLPDFAYRRKTRTGVRGYPARPDERQLI